MKRLLCVILLLSCATALAGPTRPVRSDTFTVQTPCGPPWDPIAREGQWFMDPINGTTNVSTWEFHDDEDTLSILGMVTLIQFANPSDSNSNIMAFDVDVTVFNNLPMDYQLGSSSNSHGEIQIPPIPFYEDGTMKDARITAEFAVPDPALVPNGIPPYWFAYPGASNYFIEAVNEDELGWYCWDDPQMPGGPGKFQVPTWRLQPPIIPPGQTGTATMSFIVTGTGLPSSDFRHSVIRYSQWYGADILYNRHPSLKISHWLDTLLVDNGTNNISTPPPPWWEEQMGTNYVYASDASVFYRTTFPGETAVLQITPIATNQSPDAIQLDWTALDAIDYQIQYADKLASNTAWVTIVPGMGIPPVIPSPMQWIDDGTVITNLPVWQQPQRFYRLVTP